MAVICILLLITGSLWILLPFLAATVWATMLVVATWPILESLERRLGNRRAPAVAVMTLGLLLLLVIPLWGAIHTIAEHAQEVSGLATKLAESGMPQPPEWVAKLPLVGKRLSETLTAWANAGPEGLEAKLGPYVSAAALWVFNQAGSLGGTLVQFLLVVILPPSCTRVARRRRAAFAASAAVWPARAARTPSCWLERPFEAWRWGSA